MREVKELAVNTIREHFPPEQDEKIEFHYLGFGNSSIDFQIRFWAEATDKLNLLIGRSEAIMLIKEAFDKNNIEIPFPIRTIHMASEN